MAWRTIFTVAGGLIARATKGDVGTSIARPRMRSMRRLRKQMTRFAYRQIAFVPNAGTLTLTGKSVPYGGAYRAG